MQYGGEKRRVVLTKDLTKYNSLCEIGIFGWTIPMEHFTDWGKMDDFVAVRFDNGAELDVTYSSLRFQE